MPPSTSPPAAAIDQDCSQPPLKKVHLRRPHKKSHLGCKTCKKRRIKCDEQLPSCTKCTRSNIPCPYLDYTPQQIADHREKQSLIAAAGAAAAAAVAASTSIPTASSSSSATPTSMAPTALPSPTPNTTTSIHGHSTTPPFPSSQYPFRDANHVSQALSAPTPTLPPPMGMPHITAHQLTPPPNEKYSSKFCLPPINDHTASSGPLPAKSPSNITLPAINNKRITVPSLGEEHAKITELNRRPLSSTLKLTRAGFFTDMMREAYSNWMSNTLALAYHHTFLYHAVMAFAQGFLFLKTGDEEIGLSSDKHRFIALREIQQEIGQISPASTDALLSTSLFLSWDVFFQQSKLESYMTLSRGLGAVLEKVQAVSTTTQTALCMTESLFQSMKSILFPPYDATFFNETVYQIEALSPFIHASGSPSLVGEYEFLRGYVANVAAFLKQPMTKFGTIHNPSHLYSMLKEWLEKFPPMALSSSPHQTGQAQVLYAYFHAVTCALDNLLPETRYLFQFSFMGPIQLTDPESSNPFLADPDVQARLQYPYRMITFFKMRQVELSKLSVSTDPLRRPPDDAVPTTTTSATSTSSTTTPPLYRMPKLDFVTETFVHSFLHDFNMSAHLPCTMLPPMIVGNSMPSPVSSVNEDSASATTYSSSSSSPSASSSPDAKTPLMVHGNGMGVGPGGNVGPEFGMDPPPLSSLSIGMFKTYFRDRMEILQHFVPK